MMACLVMMEYTIATVAKTMLERASHTKARLLGYTCLLEYRETERNVLN